MMLRGLGACPDFAPYDAGGGRCSNVPPGVAVSAPPADVVRNTVTGVYERVYTDSSRDLNEALYAPGAGESTRAAAEAEQAEAIRQARERGLPISCEVQTNSAPGMPAVWHSVCTVAGSVGHDAGLLIRPGGLEIAAAEARRVTGQNVALLPASPAYVPTAQNVASAATGRPNQSVPPRDTSVSMPTGVPNTGAAMSAGQGTAAVLSLGGGDGEFPWALLVVGAAALFFFGGHR